MRLNCKILRLVLVPALVFIATGCGGFSASQGVSPATFLLPGLLRADPPPARPDPTLPAKAPGQEVAQL